MVLVLWMEPRRGKRSKFKPGVRSQKGCTNMPREKKEQEPLVKRVVQDPATGRFMKGNKSAVGSGRPKKMDVMNMLRTLDEEFPDDEIVNMLRYTWETAVATKSAKTMLLVVDSIMDRKYGKSIGRQMNLNADMDKFFQAVGGQGVSFGDEDEDEEKEREDNTRRILDAGSRRDAIVDIDLGVKRNVESQESG